VWSPRLVVVGAPPLDPDTLTPASWREHVAENLGRRAPERLTDGREPAFRNWSEGYDPGTWLDRTINATREEIFPYHGLDPMP
jgi:acetoin utilization protein AcuC